MCRAFVWSVFASLCLACLSGQVLAQEPQYQGKSVAEWVRDLDGNDTGARRKAARALGKIETVPASVIPHLICALLVDEDAGVRESAAQALGDVGKRGLQGRERTRALAALNKALRDSDPMVQRSAGLAMSALEGPDGVSAVAALRKGLKDADPKIRASAAVGLAGLAQDAESAVPDLVTVLANPKEDADARVEAAVALSRIGAVPVAREAIPKLVGVLKDADNPARVRERTLWALRVHANDFKDHPDVFKSLGRVVAEPRSGDNKMLRYDAAFLLGMLQSKDAPPQSLDVLLEFLKDNDVKIYGGRVKGGETGVGDARVLAVKALQRIGAQTVRERPDIMKQLRALDANPTTPLDLRESVAQMLKDFDR